MKAPFCLLRLYHSLCSKLLNKNLNVLTLNFAQYAIHCGIDLDKLEAQVLLAYGTLTYRVSLLTNVMPLFCKNITSP
jgi:hypothetical protein